MHKFKLLVSLSTALLLFGCSIPIPRYTPSYDNVQLLKQVDSKIQINEFVAANAQVKKISVRGNILQSPYGADLVHYLQHSLEEELTKAGLLTKISNKQIDAIVEENYLQAGTSTGLGKISCTFTVKRNTAILYQKQIKIEHSWESSFIGAIAIPYATESYPKMVRMLFNKLFSDKKFIAALSE